jgi:myo-inositol 2-dehydrogenase / D-chiro-inositol 1-dehydrogenase
MTQNADRRDFLKTGAAVAAAATLTALRPAGAFAAGTDEIRVGVIGCGGRGSGAAENVLRAAKGVKIVALGDAFEDRANGLKNRIAKFASEDGHVKELGNSVDLGDRVFVGLDAYKKVIDAGVNYVILATPPGFRPIHLTAAIAAGKNVFTEKPVATDGTGIRKVLEAYEAAKKANLGIGAGTQRRHQSGYLEVMKRIHGGEIGELVGGRGYWNQGILWRVPRQEGWTDLQAQLRNWYNFTWLCGDHIVEQHVHNLDVINWGFGTHPVEVVSMGFRTRTDRLFHNIYDFFASDFTYPNGVHVISQCRQISGCANGVHEALVGTKGTAETQDRARYHINGKSVFNPRKDNLPYEQEHTDLIASIRKGEPINELKNVAESTLTAIMARMSAYSGQRVTWEQALNTTENLWPAEQLTWDMKLGEAPLAIPGKTKLG